MKTADIKTGEYYRIKRLDDTVRVEGFAEPRWDGDKRTVRASRFLAGGILEVIVAPRDIVELVTPDARTLRIIQYIELMTKHEQETSAVGPYGTDEALILKDEGEHEGHIYGPCWHRLAGGKDGEKISGGWITSAVAAQLAKNLNLNLYIV